MSSPEKTAEILRAFDDLARLFGNPAPRPVPTEDERRAEESDMRRHDIAEAEAYFDTEERGRREDRNVRGWLGRCA